MHLTSGWKEDIHITQFVAMQMIVLYTAKRKHWRCKIKEALDERFAFCKLELHPIKTKVVYCKDSNRKATEDNIRFTFLGYTFQPRKAKGVNGKEFTSFLPVVSQDAQKRIRQDIRKWKLLKLNHIGIEEIAQEYNLKIRGWLNYYGWFGQRILADVLEHINLHLVLWVKSKFKKLKRKKLRAIKFLGRIANQNKELFAHWSVGILPTTG